MEKITLKPTRGKNVSFKGKEIACASGQWEGGREQSRYTTLRLYRTESGKYVISDKYTTQWQGESCQEDVFVLESAKAVFEHLERTDGALGRLGTRLVREAGESDQEIAAILTVEI